MDWMDGLIETSYHDLCQCLLCVVSKGTTPIFLPGEYSTYSIFNGGAKNLSQYEQILLVNKIIVYKLQIIYNIKNK